MDTALLTPQDMYVYHDLLDILKTFWCQLPEDSEKIARKYVGSM
jgi:hypothetical protein